MCRETTDGAPGAGWGGRRAQELHMRRGPSRAARRQVLAWPGRTRADQVLGAARWRCGRRRPSRRRDRRGGQRRRSRAGTAACGRRRRRRARRAAGRTAPPSTRAFTHMPCAIARLNPNAFAVSPDRWIGFTSPETFGVAAAGVVRDPPGGRHPLDVADRHLDRRPPARPRAPSRRGPGRSTSTAPDLLAGRRAPSRAGRPSAPLRCVANRSAQTSRSSGSSAPIGAQHARSGCARAPAPAAPAGTTRSLISAICSGNASMCG